MAGAPHAETAFARAIGEFIDRNALVPPGARVLAGVSGGADSVALLSALREISGNPGRDYRLTVAHLNHGLRRSADGDERFVRRLAGQWELPCVVERCDVRALAAERSVGIEEAARDARYGFLERVACDAGAKYVAVGHNADDQVETVLFRIVRGTHLRGLAGMPAQRELGHSGTFLIRPLLDMTRDRIEAYCRERGLHWRTDETNADVGYARNFIRHELLPLIRRRLNPRADEAILRLAGTGKEAHLSLGEIAAEAMRRAAPVEPLESGCLRVLVEPLCGQPFAVQAYVLRTACEALSLPIGSLSAAHVEQLRELLLTDLPGSCSLPGGWEARREGGVLVFQQQGRSSDRIPWAPVSLKYPGTTELLDGRRVLCNSEPLDEKAFADHCRTRPPGVELFDADQVQGALVCRPRRDCDVFVPLGAPGRQTVSDFLTNAKVPPAERDRVLCICDELGIVYLAPLRIDHRVRVTERTRRVLRIELTAPEEGRP